MGVAQPAQAAQAATLNCTSQSINFASLPSSHCGNIASDGSTFDIDLASAVQANQSNFSPGPFYSLQLASLNTGGPLSAISLRNLEFFATVNSGAETPISAWALTAAGSICTVSSALQSGQGVSSYSAANTIATANECDSTGDNLNSCRDASLGLTPFNAPQAPFNFDAGMMNAAAFIPSAQGVTTIDSFKI